MNERAQKVLDQLQERTRRDFDRIAERRKLSFDRTLKQIRTLDTRRRDRS